MTSNIKSATLCRKVLTVKYSYSRRLPEDLDASKATGQGFFFKEGVQWSSLTEVRLNDAYGKSAGNIDVVLVAYDEKGKVTTVQL